MREPFPDSRPKSSSSVALYLRVSTEEQRERQSIEYPAGSRQSAPQDAPLCGFDNVVAKCGECPLKPKIGDSDVGVILSITSTEPEKMKDPQQSLGSVERCQCDIQVLSALARRSTFVKH